MKKCIILSLPLFFFQIHNSTLTAQHILGNGQPTLVIHGGAGNILKSNIPEEQRKAYHRKLQEALKAGYDVLDDGGSAEKAVVTAITVMEDSPLFNAGKGSVFTSEGTNEMDASIMNGFDGSSGAVAGVKTIKNPILAAQKVKNNSVHVMMAGRGAEAFAAETGLEIVDPAYFFTQKRKAQLEKVQKAEKSNEEGNIKHWEDYKFGTVGAVALDKNGNICAATSTGGMTNKKYGRIGDTPIIGAGTFANKSCGVSATGHGEFFIRNVVSYDVAALMEYKSLTLAQASDQVISEKLTSKGGSGGIIALDATGNISMIFNTAGMFRGYIQKGSNATTYLFGKED